MKLQEHNSSNERLTKNSQKLRREMTKEEKHLWYDFLSTFPMRFRRQKTVGKYIVDFYCFSKQIIIELDGSQHFENNKQIQKDKERDEFLQRLGFTVLRYSNLEVQTNFRGVCDDIYSHLNI
ncbi:MAG: endonuclease domain-containing protein [Ruminococcus sp.]|nr:endonuclease domain-containing protein [Ruminococcus sp.]